MSYTYTICRCPEGDGGFGVYGRVSRAEAIRHYRSYIEELRDKVIMADAVSDDELEVFFQRGNTRLLNEVK